MSHQEMEYREKLRQAIMERVVQTEERRKEALNEFFSVTVPAMSQESAEAVSSLIPPLLPSLYDKWISMFLERLFETVPMEQIELMCDGTQKGKATAVLVFIMFMESARMEKQVESDLTEYARAHSLDEDMGGLAADYLRAKSVHLAEQVRKETEN